MTKFEKLELAFWRLSRESASSLAFEKDFIMKVYQDKKIIGELTTRIHRGHVVDRHTISLYIRDLETNTTFEATEEVSPKQYEEWKKKFMEAKTKAIQKWKDKRESILDKLAGLS